MRRIFRKYNLLLWLGVLLVVGLLANSAVMLMMSRDVLQRQSEQKILPLTSEQIYDRLQVNFARASVIAARSADDGYLEQWLASDEQDNQALIARLKSAKQKDGSQKDGSILYFLVSEKDQKYIDSVGTVRALRPDEQRDAWYRRVHDSTVAIEFTVVPDLGGENQPILFVSHRLFDADHEVIGATGFNMPLALLANSQHENVAIYFVDQVGKVVLSDTGKTGNIHQLAGISQIADSLLKDSKQEQSLAYELGASRINLHARFVPELNWYLITEEPEQLAPSWKLAVVNASIAGVVTILALLLAWFFIVHHQSRMRALASKDSMTGLLNRQTFTSSFHQTVLEMQRLKLPVSFILFDIDYLKKINESHGHATGDKIIMDIARLSKKSVRGSDLLCRWSGEQFALLLKRCDLEQAYKVAEQLRLNVQNHSFSFEDGEASVTISLGVAEWTENETIDELFGRVDEAVYLAKSEGRNRAEISYFVNA